MKMLPKTNHYAAAAAAATDGGVNDERVCHRSSCRLTTDRVQVPHGDGDDDDDDGDDDDDYDDDDDGVCDGHCDDDVDDDDDGDAECVVVYRTVTPCYCSMLRALYTYIYRESEIHLCLIMRKEVNRYREEYKII